jgi:hypothetical protein
MRIGRERLPLYVNTRDGYGPRKRNASYVLELPTGTYLIERHQWVAPRTRWAWKAKPLSGSREFVEQKTRYADTLVELGVALGLGWPEETA